MTSTVSSFASTPEVRARMQRQARRDTALEKSLRSALYKRGMRYRLQVQILPRRTSDIVFPRAKVIVDVRSCFWHSCSSHCSIPRSNREWWIAKLTRTASRDADTETRLRAAGWAVVVVWAHDDIERAADGIANLVRVRCPLSNNLSSYSGAVGQIEVTCMDAQPS
jgi:DNA mismatch endonuclease, patch repair protein